VGRASSSSPLPGWRDRCAPRLAQRSTANSLESILVTLGLGTVADTADRVLITPGLADSPITGLEAHFRECNVRSSLDCCQAEFLSAETVDLFPSGATRRNAAALFCTTVSAPRQTDLGPAMSGACLGGLELSRVYRPSTEVELRTFVLSALGVNGSQRFVGHAS
jgi:hypothetical protein